MVPVLLAAKLTVVVLKEYDTLDNESESPPW
jgi:hypothetical protein